MARERERVHIEVPDTATFAGLMGRAQEAAKLLNRTLTMADATWEPHDWRDFD